MKKNIIIITAFVIALCPSIVFAKEQPQKFNNMEKVAEATKYIKTVTEIPSLATNAYNSNTVNFSKSYSVEVSEEEYNNANETIVSTNESGSVETTYKRLTTTINQNGDFFNYAVELFWKTIPQVRSFDILGIGIDQSVAIATTPFYQQMYCLSSGECAISYTHTPKMSIYGAGTVFQLMPGNVNYMKSMMSFNVDKDTTSTILNLRAAGDYSHATTSIDFNTAKSNYSIGAGGIMLNSSVSGYYDDIQPAEAFWYGSW